MKLLEKLGLIKNLGRDETQPIKYVLLRPVDSVVKALKSQNKLINGWLNAYTAKKTNSPQRKRLTVNAGEVLRWFGGQLWAPEDNLELVKPYYQIVTRTL